PLHHLDAALLVVVGGKMPDVAGQGVRSEGLDGRRQADALVDAAEIAVPALELDRRAVEAVPAGALQAAVLDETDIAVDGPEIAVHRIDDVLGQRPVEDFACGVQRAAAVGGDAHREALGAAQADLVPDGLDDARVMAASLPLR